MQKKWTSKVVMTEQDQYVRLNILEDDQPLTFRQVFNYWNESIEFIDFYIALINSFEYLAFYWEHPGLTPNYLDYKYEFILKASPRFDRRNVNEKAFSKYLDLEDEVVIFDNLGKNAKLVVPTKKQEAETYKHMGSFLRKAPQNQVRDLFQKIGSIVFSEISEKDMIWLNTAGLGVIWLHVRLDTVPKYYKTKPYKAVDFLDKRGKWCVRRL